MSQSTIIYIALLRGINVGGHRIKMDYLRELFRNLGFDNVRSFIQTGNIFFETVKKDKIVLQKTIEASLERELGYNVAVCLRTIDELEDLIKLNPFKNRELTPETRFSVTFLTREVKEKLPIPSTTPDGGYELIGMTPSELFIVWHLKNGRPGSSYGFDKNIDAESTTRFWHTTEKILNAVKKL